MAEKHSGFEAQDDIDMNSKNIINLNQCSGYDAQGNINFIADKGIKTLVGCRAFTSANQNIGAATITTVQLNTDSGTGGWDLGNDFNTATYTFTAPVSGYYQVNASVWWQSTTAGQYIRTYIQVNGTTRIYNNKACNDVYNKVQNVSGVLYLAANDTVVLRCYHGIATVVNATYNATYMDIFLLSVA